MKSFPMLDTRFAADIVRSSVTENKSVATLAEEAATSHPKSRLSETGLSPATDADLQSLRDAVLTVAEKFGYPNRTSAKSHSFSDFDREATHVFTAHIDAPVNDARSTELWNFITAVLLLDVASWRFPNIKGDPRFERYLGISPKSTFKKLWWRGHVLGELSDRIGEDQSVALLERTSTAGDPRLPKMIIHHLLAVLDSDSAPSGTSKYFRKVMTRINARRFTVCIESLSEDQLDQLVQDCVDSALAR
ncbi:hypothetical protein ACTXK0_06745 [Corynebacterium variabile]|uniref:Uncharacterized protein n=1 Tax=Corynebacterium variabile TaxID=1727 RepID=A0A0X2NQG8_9CORY|nr:hypothetical protein [Corynebacterium variabile]CUU67038.1 hypothetical protein CVAR292_02391 [Corynebacterium variabile]